MLASKLIDELQIWLCVCTWSDETFFDPLWVFFTIVSKKWFLFAFWQSYFWCLCKKKSIYFGHHFVWAERIRTYVVLFGWKLFCFFLSLYNLFISSIKSLWCNKFVCFRKIFLSMAGTWIKSYNTDAKQGFVHR